MEDLVKSKMKKDESKYPKRTKIKKKEKINLKGMIKYKTIKKGGRFSVLPRLRAARDIFINVAMEKMEDK